MSYEVIKQIELGKTYVVNVDGKTYTFFIIQYLGDLYYLYLSGTYHAQRNTIEELMYAHPDLFIKAGFIIKKNKFNVQPGQIYRSSSGMYNLVVINDISYSLVNLSSACSSSMYTNVTNHVLAKNLEKYDFILTEYTMADILKTLN